MLITPAQSFLKRLIPAIVLEAVGLALCVVLFVSTDNMNWIFAAAGVAVLFALWVLFSLWRHRDGWRVTSQKVIR